MTDLLQNTDAWREARKKRVGASDVPILLGLSPYKTAFELWAEKLGLESRPANEFATSRGHALEPAARGHYEDLVGFKVLPQVFFSEEHDFIMASLDGYNHEKKISVEIKCVGKELHLQAEAGVVPLHYMPQLQTQMYCAKLERCHYFSFDGQDGALIEVKRDDEFIDKMILPAAIEFKKLLDTRNPPELTARDFKKSKDPELQELVDLHSILKQDIKMLEAKQDELREKIFAKCDWPRVIVGKTKIISAFRKGSIDYSKIPELDGVDLEPYRKEGTSYRMIK